MEELGGCFIRSVMKSKAEPGGLSVTEAPVREPGYGEALVKISMSAICGSDLHIYAWNNWAQNLYRDILPMPMGHEFCGTVEKTGEGVTDLTAGTRVSAETHIWCGSCDKCRRGMNHICDNLQLFSKTKAGCFSTYTTVPAKCLIPLPDTVSDLEGSLMEPFGVAVRAVEEAQVSGQSVLIQGCGAIGLMAVQAAKALGACQIIALDLDRYRLDLALELGADYVVDPARSDPVKQVLELTNGIGIRRICEFTGNIGAIQTGFRYIAKGGRYIFTGLPSRKLELDVVRDLVNREITMQGCYGRKIYQTWNTCFDLIESGKVDLSKAATHRYPLSAYKEAFQTALGRQCGKVLFMNQQ